MLLELKGLRRLNIGPIDFAIDTAECVSISGRSGAGKSVLLRAIADLDPHEGDVLLQGAHCSSMPAPQWRRQVTYVAAESGWWEDTVRQHFLADTDFATLLPKVGVDPAAADKPVHQLSTGERQRLALIRALCLKSKVLLLDEPTSALDPESVHQVETLLQEYIAEGMAILMVTHDIEQALRMANRHVRLAGGQLTPISTDELQAEAQEERGSNK